MIEVRNISKSYGDLQAVSQLNFTVQEGHVVGFLGANGAGKTTTMDIICGCIGPDQGSVTIAGYDILEQPNQAKRLLGYLPDEPPIHDDMYVREFVEYSAVLHQVPTRDLSSYVDQALQRLDLENVAKRLVGNLSKGYRQRVALAQAIVHKPKVLILDEPTEGLDPNQIIEIRKLISELKGQHTIILSSHILSEVENTCDEFILIDKGKIVAMGDRVALESGLSQTTSSKFAMRVAHSVDHALNLLRSMPIITEVEKMDEHEVNFAFSGEEAEIEKILKVIVQEGVALRELRSHKNSLEDVFLRLTRGV